MHQQRKKEESERLRGERDQIKSIDRGFERWQVVRFGLPSIGIAHPGNLDAEIYVQFE